jgi:MYXO-CTERM domain-containing protein
MGCSDPATDATKGQCVADADLGQTTTSPLNPDTDDGTKLDNAEDANGNGVVDSDETNPNDPSDDVGCTVDADCGSASSGRICENEACIDGCRWQGGNGCPPDMTCTSTTDAPGQCEPEQTTEPPPTPQTDAGAPPPQPDAGVTAQPDLGYFGGGGCSCTIGRTGASQNGFIAFAILLGIGFAVRRFRRKYK